MAEQIPDSNEDMSDEFIKSIDVKYVLHCDPCKDEGKQLQAAGFCVDCNDYLCKECFDIHTRARPLRNHALKDMDDLSKSKLKRKRKTMQCHEHKNEPIKWYCTPHDKCICNICRQGDHRKCTDIKSITNVCQDFLSSDKLKEVKDRLTQLQTDFEKTVLRVKENNEAVESYYTAAIDEVVRSISKIKNEDLKMLKALEVTCDTTVKTISSMLNEIEILEKSGEEDQAFLATRKTELQLQVFDDRLESVGNDNKITKYKYVCEPMSKADGMIGKMFAWEDGRGLNVDNIEVKTSTDTSFCNITGIERLSDNRLVFTDNNNYKIKLVDMTSKTVISELKLDCKPFDLTRIDDSNIAVTMFDTKKILLVSISEKLTVQKTIETCEIKSCLGIVYSNNTLMVSYYDPNQIQILNLDGTVKQIIEAKDAHGNARFGDVGYMTQCPDTNILYFSDWSSNKVLGMTLDGQVISSCTHKYLRAPRGITACKDGRICVCSGGTNKIFEISSDLSEGQVILDEKDGIAGPHSILYDKHKLYVGQFNNNSIQIFLI